jgi:hypothetical protein
LRYKLLESAILAVESLTGQVHDILSANGKPLKLSFGQEVESPGSVPEPAPAFSHDISIPGLDLKTDFLTEAEESRLLEGICDIEGPWLQGLSRRVQVEIMI